MDQAALVTEEINAGTELVHEFDKFRPVKVAFWLKASDSEHRYLYIASDQIDDENRKAAYGEVLRLAQGIQSPFLDPFRVKVIGADHPLAKAAADVHRRFPAPRTVPTRFGGQSFGGMSVDDVFIYPPMLAAVP